jgi:hypothetical protein
VTSSASSPTDNTQMTKIIDNGSRAAVNNAHTTTRLPNGISIVLPSLPQLYRHKRGFRLRSITSTARAMAGEGMGAGGDSPG